MQERMSTANKAAWETKAYQAWLADFGSPETLAAELRTTKTHLLRYWLKYMGDPAGKRILNLLGSNGRKAVSLALLGADVTVVDISEENKRYATQVAAAAGVEIDYICADALRIPDEDALGEFDFVLMEFGVLHYFADLNDIFAVVRRRLRSRGRYLLTDYHPFARAWARTPNLSEPDGNYFDDRAKEGDAAFSKLLPEEEREGLRQVLVRGWTVGEIVTAVGTAGLCLRAFEELPSPTDPRIPEFYTLVADKLDIELPPLTP